jgi:hypothetical protein
MNEEDWGGEGREGGRGMVGREDEREDDRWNISKRR